MFNVYSGKGRTITAKSRLFVTVSLLSLIVLLAFALSNLMIANAGQTGRQTINTMGDKDDLANAPGAPVSCTRGSNGQGTIQGTITDVKTGHPIGNAYIGVSPGVVNSFACYTHTNSDGTFQIPKLPAGTYNLSASRWTVSGTSPLYRDSIVRQIPVGNSTATVRLALTPIPAPGYRVIGKHNAKNVFVVDMDETYFNSWFTDKHSVADPKLTPAIHSLAKVGVNASEDWTQYGYSPIDHYQLATGAYPTWRTPDGPAPYWTQPDPNLDTNLWYSGGPQTGEEFGQESIFDVAKSYGMNTAIIGGNDYPAGHITNANVDQIQLTALNPCSAPIAEVKQVESFVNTHLHNPNGVMVYIPLTQAEGFNTENVSPDAPPAITSCQQVNGWTYSKASIWNDQALAALLKYMGQTKQGNSTLLQNSTVIVTADEAQNDHTNFDNFYPTQPGEPGLGTTRHIPFVMEGPNIKQGDAYTAQLRIDDTSVNMMASLGLPAPADSRGHYISQFFQHTPESLLPFAQHQSIPSQGFIPLVENNVDGYSTIIQGQNESTAPSNNADLTIFDPSGKVVFNKTYNAPLPPNADWIIYADALGLPKGFVGTALLRADQPLAVMSTEARLPQQATAKSVEGYVAAEVGSNLYAPVMDRNVNGATSSIAITNLAPCSQCSTMVTVDFYGADGKLVTEKKSKLAEHGQWLLSASSLAQGSGSSTVSAIVSSNAPEPLAATVFTKTNTGRSFSYNALSAGDIAITSPLVLNGVSGSTTSLTLQNTSNTAATATITYRDQTGKTVLSKQVSLSGYGSVTQSAGNIGLPAQFSGSASITSAQKIAVISRIIARTGDVSAFNTVRSIDFSLYTASYIPLVENSFNNITSAVTVTNTGSNTTTTQIAYFNHDGVPVGNTPTASLAPGASYTFNQGDSSSGLPTYFAGSAYVSSSAAQHLAVTVTLAGNGTIRSYNGSQAQTGQLILTISQLRQNYFSFTGQVVTVINAIVTRNYGSNWFIQDNTGGIRVYVGGGVGQQMGDIETVTGVLSEYSGEIEIDPQGQSGVVKTGTGTVPNPIVVTTKQIAQLKYTDAIDGELVTIPDSTITAYAPPSLGLTDSSNVQCIAYFDSAALKNINLSNFKQGERVVTTGVLVTYGSDLSHAVGEIEPLLTSDFVAHS